ncbi:MAG TPA: PDZ domain-containing protein, partial [Bryobacteraceae bacterium]|nr:PDZ domain-containing protein [Bryobacteraceae bacterium]
MRVLTLCCAMLGMATLSAQTPDPHQGGRNGGAVNMQPYVKVGSFLGVGLADVNSQRARSLGLDEPKGTEVVRVEPGSSAAKAGLKPGDVLLTYNGENVLGGEQLGRLVRETPPDRKVKIKLWRDGHPSEVMVLTEAPKQSFLMGTPDLPNPTMPDFPSAMLMWKSGILGIYCESVDSQLAEYFGVKQGVLVRFVVNGSAAQHAGLKAGDVLTKVGDRVVGTPRDVTVALHLEAP